MKTRKNFFFDNEVIVELTIAAAYRTREEGTHISVAEMVRRGAMRELEEHHSPASLYKHPRSLETIRAMGQRN